MRLFFVKVAKNNKVDHLYLANIYTIKKMPNTKSAVRRVRRVKKQTQVNRIRKSKYKSAIKQMETILNSKDKDKAQKKIFQNFNQF